MAGTGEECNVCCWADDVVEGDYSNCSGAVEGPSGSCVGGAVKVPCLVADVL
ncbi:MAG: hypothetical protein U5J95_02740 [Balneolaceae bacterium]|nr:hypothetical protein [Balneolaceae bacterium]